MPSSHSTRNALWSSINRVRIRGKRSRSVTISVRRHRLIEFLSQPVSTKLRETKQYYTLYNTLDDTKLFLSKEISLLNSIHDNFERAMSSSANKEQFLKQFAQILKGIQENKSKVDERQTREKMTRDQLSAKVLSLVEKERSYFKTVKEYEEECSKNELLLAKLKRRGIAAE